MLDDFIVEEKIYNQRDKNKRHSDHHYYNLGKVQKILRYHGKIANDDEHFYPIDRAIDIDNEIADQVK